MKQYTIQLEQQESDFYETAASHLKIPVEEILQNVLLKYAADLARKALQVNQDGGEQ